MSRYGVFFGPHFTVFGVNAKTYWISVFNLNIVNSGPKKTLYLDIFHAVIPSSIVEHLLQNKLLKNIWIYGSFSWIGFNCLKLVEPPSVESLLLTTITWKYWSKGNQWQEMSQTLISCNLFCKNSSWNYRFSQGWVSRIFFEIRGISC